MGLPPLTTLSACMASRSAPTSLTAPTTSGLAVVVDENEKQEGEERTRQLNEFARQQLQVALYVRKARMCSMMWTGS